MVYHKDTVTHMSSKILMGVGLLIAVGLAVRFSGKGGALPSIIGDLGAAGRKLINKVNSPSKNAKGF
jgi:hypothetical protein